MSYTIYKQSVFWISIYLLGYFDLDIKICFLFISAWLIITAWARKTRKSEDPHGGSEAFSKSNLKRHHLPAWVLHPDTERSEWINSIIHQLWPFFETYVRDVLLSIEKNEALKSSLQSYAIQSISFPSFHLGTIPPRITGVKVHTSVHRKEIILDINLDYAGDCKVSVLFGVGIPSLSKVVYLKGGLQNFSLKTCLRLHLSPLLRDTPFVGSVGFSFLDIPDFDFVLTGLAQVLDFPGIEALLKNVISNQIEEYFVNPNSFKIALHPSSKSTTFSSSKRLEEGETHSLSMPSGVLSIRIIEAKGLENKDVNLIGNSNKSDPYATLEVLADSLSHNYKTHVIRNSLHPVWNYTAELIVDDSESLDRMLLHIWDKDSSNKDDFLGKCELPLSGVKTALQGGEPQDFWTLLEDVQRGSVHTSVSWSELTCLPQGVSSELNGQAIGVFVIEIDSCSNLLGGRTGLKLPNPKVVVELCGEIQETAVVHGSIHPVFEHRMKFLVSNPKVDSLKLSVMDTRKNSRVGECFGTLRLKISDFLAKENLSALNQQFTLKSRTLKPENESPFIIISASFRYIEIKVHKKKEDASSRVQDLHKRLLSSPSKPNPPPVQLTSPPPSIVLSPPKSLNESSEDLLNNNNNSREDESLTAIDIKSSTPLSIPDLISVSQKYNLHMPAPPSSPGKGQNGKFPDYRAKLRLSIKYNSMTKTLSVVVHQAKNIPVFPHSNIGVKLYLLEELLPHRLIRRLKHGKRKTKTQKTPEPTFEETLEYFLPEKELLTRKLEAVVEIHKGLRAKTIGAFIVDLVPLTNNSTLTKWYVLQLHERFEEVTGFPFKGGLHRLKFSPTHSLKMFKSSSGDA